MRKPIACLLIIILLCSLAIAPGRADHGTFTLLIYMCGTDLESSLGAASSDIREILGAGLDPDGPVTVLMELGGAKQWHLNTIDPFQTERWAVYGDRLFRVDELPRRDMGDPATLRSFLEYGVAEFPADRYGLILWNHGGGMTGGVCYDEYTGNYLTSADIRAALAGASVSTGGFYLDFIAFDACLMASFEMANYVKEYARYMVASEEVTPLLGFDYKSFLGALAGIPGLDALSLCEAIVDGFMETNMACDPDDYMTLSVLDLQKMDALTWELERMSEGLSLSLGEGALSTISRYRRNMRSFGDYINSASDMVDLRLFVEVYAGVSGIPAAPVLRALGDVVVYNRFTRHNLDHISGISILSPFRSRQSFAEYAAGYDAASVFPSYTAFITQYMALVNGGDYVFNPGAPQHVSVYSAWGGAVDADEEKLDLRPEVPMGSGGGAPTAAHAPPLDEVSAFQFFVDAAPYAGEETEPMESTPLHDGYLAYALTLSDEDMEHLSYVEGNLMMDISQGGFESYIDLGYLQQTAIDWENNTVYSMFDGTWPMLEGQLVSMTDQSVTAKSRRSIIDVQINGEETYLLVVFDEERPGGEVIGYTEGYNVNGLPVRGHHKLRPGDVIVPMYFRLYWDENNAAQYERFEGGPIPYTGEPLSFAYSSLVGKGLNLAYAFCLNGIFGDCQFSDFVFFSL